jgi:hypothetical protein
VLHSNTNPNTISFPYLVPSSNSIFLTASSSSLACNRIPASAAACRLSEMTCLILAIVFWS